MDVIRKVETTDVDIIYDYEKLFFKDYWSKDQILIEITNNNAFNLVFEKDSRLVAYIFTRNSVDFVEILKIAVSKSFRKIGIAKKLIKEVELFISNSNTSKIFLEVREGNEAAISLYKEFGFKIDGIRKNYYKKYNENALLMSKELS